MNTLIVYHNKYAELVSYVIKLFPKHLLKERETLVEEDYSNIDLIIVVGGDGTFLRANLLNKNIPVIGINPDQNKKVGFFTRADISDYKLKLEKIKKDIFEIQKILRLETYINGEKLKDLCLNEIYIGDLKPYNMFNYDISINNRIEFQRSSGVLVSAPCGSYAWIKSAGGKEIKLSENKFQYLVREPYISRLTPKYDLLKGILNHEESIKIVVKTPGILVMDSISNEYKLEKEDIVEIKKSPYDLKFIII